MLGWFDEKKLASMTKDAVSTAVPVAVQAAVDQALQNVTDGKQVVVVIKEINLSMVFADGGGGGGASSCGDANVTVNLGGEKGAHTPGWESSHAY